MKRLIFSVLFTLLLISPANPLFADQKEDSGHHHEQKDEAPKADSVWGAMKYSGHHIKNGSVKAGSGIKHGSIKAGRGIKKGGKAMGRGFKKAGGSIKKFFAGGN